MIVFLKKYIIHIALFIILVWGGVLRFYKITQNPPSLSWDETAVGYNAWTILNWGKDEWGKTLPLVFKSFEDDKHPVHIYLTIPTVAIFGPNELGVRTSSALFGTLNILIIFFLARKLFKSNLAGLAASFVLAISRYAIHFSRFNHELNFALFFFMSGIYLILEGLTKKNYLLVLGFISLGIDLLTYHSAKIVVPPVLILMMVLYLKNFLAVKKYFVWGVVVFFFFIGILLINPALLGGARFRQTSSSNDRQLGTIYQKYISHFSYTYLFEQGDKNPRLSAQTGTFYKYDIIFLVIGSGALIWGIVKGKKEYLILFAWAILAPIPSSITSEAPHAARALFMMGSWHLIITLGIYTCFSFLRSKYAKLFFGGALVAGYMFLLSNFWKSYLHDYQDRYAIEWQYGMKQISEFVKDHPEYDEVYITPDRQQPYIFPLFYNKVTLPVYLKTVKYNNSASRPANTVLKFSKYNFSWNPIESEPIPHILYVVTPAHYTGLKHLSAFDTVSVIKYPNGADAFYLVSAKVYE